MNSINLRALQRIDSSVTYLVESASQTAVYKFGDDNTWQPCEFEGSLHVFHRSEEPRFGWIVINRSNPTNLMELLTKGVEIQMTAPYLLYKNADNTIYCIWFYDAIECKNVSNTIQKLMATTHNRSSNPIRNIAD